MICHVCKLNKADSEFYKDNWYKKNQLRRLCKLCDSQRRRLNHLKSAYGLTKEDFENLLAKQNNACDICKTPFIEQHKICVDHCHVTGKTRGLLCHSCNLFIGHLDRALKATSNTFAEAMRYLNHYA